MSEILPESARISDPDQHQLMQGAQVELHQIPNPELEYQRELQTQAGPRNQEAANVHSNPNKKRKSLPTDGSGTAQRRSAQHRAPGAPVRTPEAISGRSVSMSGQGHIYESVTAVAGTGEKTRRRARLVPTAPRGPRGSRRTRRSREPREPRER